MDIRKAFGMEPSEEQQAHAELQLDYAELQQALAAERAKNHKLAERVAQLEAERDRDRYTLDGYGYTISELRSEVQTLRQAGPIALYAAEVIEDLEESGDIILEADKAAKEIVVDRIKDQSIALVVDKLLEQRGDTMRANMTPQAIEELIAEQDKVLDITGEYDRVDDKVEAAKRTEIRDDLIEERVEQVEEQLDTPEIKAQKVAQARQELARTGELEKIEAEVRRELEKMWRREAVEQTRIELRKQLEEKRTAWEEEFSAEWLGSFEGRDYIRNVEKQLAREWKDSTVADLQARVKDVRLGQLLVEKTEDAIADLADEAIQRNQLEDFMAGGMDTHDLPEGSELTIQLGPREMLTDRSRGYDFDSRNRSYLKVTEQLGLTALKERGLYAVKSHTGDLEYGQPYPRRLRQGEVIAIGRALIWQGEEIFSPLIVMGNKLAYDTDPSSPETFQVINMAVTNIVINGLSARTAGRAVLPGGTEVQLNPNRY